MYSAGPFNPTSRYMHILTYVKSPKTFLLCFIRSRLSSLIAVVSHVLNLRSTKLRRSDKHAWTKGKREWILDLIWLQMNDSVIPRLLGCVNRQLFANPLVFISYSTAPKWPKESVNASFKYLLTLTNKEVWS